MEKFGGRAIGALLFIFGLACTLPLPPGATTIFGFPLLLLAPQLVIGSRAPWLPERVKSRTLSTADLKKALPKAIPTLQKVEAISKPRLVFLFGSVGERVLGLVCTALALVLILPIPGGNILPAMAVSALSFALIQRDGIIALVGYALAGDAGVVPLVQEQARQGVGVQLDVPEAARPLAHEDVGRHRRRRLAAGESRAGTGRQATDLGDHVAQVFVVDPADLLQRRQIAPGQQR